MTLTERKIKKAGLALAAVAFWGSLTPSAFADVIINVSGTEAASVTNSLGNGPAVGFSLAADYNNVSITAPLVAFFGGGNWDFNAYLTDQLGAGTTAVDNEIASRTETIAFPGSNLFPPYTITQFTVFSGLNLQAGNYYMTLGGSFNTASVFWLGSANADLVTTTNGGTVTATGLLAGVQDPYLPASLFIDTSDPSVFGENAFGQWFTVTGDLANPSSAVPEPSSVVLLSFGLIGVVVASRRKRRVQV